ncbi:uncharacterized protein LOC117581034 [Drosophila guanche]|uniref:Uncharacterized protein n=1 Tax=Drosophila guanche TaxID=7266 RepID=A0A3B0J5K4_DROGU|nr:uncharacterized protein LOC117581034 [Drosophila guanche]SPP74952.1 Hypothetical predicted protein [Drosophila guanche]
MSPNAAKKRAMSSAQKRRKLRKSIPGCRKPPNALSSALIRRICRLPPKRMQAHPIAEVRYLNPEFRKVDEPGAATSVCTVCHEIHSTPAVEPNEPLLEKVQQETQTEPCWGCSCHCNFSGDQSNLQGSKQVTAKTSNRMSSEQYYQKSSSSREILSASQVAVEGPFLEQVARAARLSFRSSQTSQDQPVALSHQGSVSHHLDSAFDGLS